MTTHRAACNCGRLEVLCEGEPRRISLCHCFECQRRTGSVFGVQAWFLRQEVAVTGDTREFARVSDRGNLVTFRFCPVCGSTVCWEAAAFPGLIAVAVGSFADSAFPAPNVAVWERRRHEWVDAFADLPMEHVN
ncbi:MAG TPA: GFA family protein [Roseiarcus sp.]|nr:GFA family protein [Roseiarcus sp.]